MTAPTRPVLRYHGGKWRLAPWIISHFPSHQVYVEPFGGAASVLGRKPRSYAEVYNDLDSDVVNVFRVLRRNPDELLRRLSLTPFSREEFEASYSDSDDPIERARRMIFRSYSGFGSDAVLRTQKTGFRSNSNRSGTTPAHDWANYPDSLRLWCERFAGVVIENRPAIEVMRKHDSADTLHYVDPPYVHATRSRVVRAYRYAYSHEMTNEDHEQLAECLRELKGMVVLSGYPSELYARLFMGWKCITRTAFADGANERTEALWLNAATESRLQPNLMEVAA